MRFRIVLLLLTVIFTTSRPLVSNNPTVEKSPQIEVKQLGQRAKILADYLARHNSPLQYHAQDFIDAADTYSVDWRLVPSIAGVESTFGKRIPGGFNAWGWGVYGNQALGFDSWKDGIYTVTGGLKKNYIDKGLTEPYSMNQIYAASPVWGGKVTFFINDLEKFSQRYLVAPDSIGVAEVKTVNALTKTAGTSATVR